MKYALICFELKLLAIPVPCISNASLVLLTSQFLDSTAHLSIKTWAGVELLRGYKTEDDEWAWR